MSRRARIAGGALVAAVTLGGCGSGGSAPSAAESTEAQASGAPGAGAAPQTDAGATGVAPVTTTEADWKPVADALGRAGKLMDATVYRVGLPRADLKVRSDGVTIAPGLSLSGYAAFAKYPDGSALVMGDLVVTEAEVGKVTDALQAQGIAQTAIHKHLLTQTPPIWWTHFHAHGDPAAIARSLRAVLAKTAIPAPKPPPASPAPVDLDTKGIDTALGRTGTADGGIYKFTIARAETITDDGMVLPPAMGVTTAINFQPTGGKRAAVNGDFAMTAGEVQKVLQALRAHGIQVVEVHNHMLADNPRLFYAHFWAEADAVKLAQGLRAALDATDVKPAT